MFKLLPVALVVLVLFGVLAYLLINRPNASPNQKPLVSSDINSPVSTNLNPQAPDSDRLRDLEEAVTLIAEKVNKINSNLKPTATPSTGDDYAALKTSVYDLQSRLQAVEKTLSVTPTSGPATNPPAYIPLGANITAGNIGYYSVPGFLASVDPGQYPNYSGLSLEVTMNLSQPNDTGYARLLNITDNSPVSGSEVTTGSTDSVLLKSGSFKLPTGGKNYQLQVYSKSGSNLTVQTARLKVSF